MPPHLHPRSRMTSSLFATTLLASFVVVAMPHLLPCPVPRTKYADGEVVVDENGRRRRWRRREALENEGTEGTESETLVQFNQVSIAGGDAEAYRTKRVCPVPKPGGILGEWLGFHKSKNDESTKGK